MANISYNQIHETLDEATMATIFGKLNEIINLLPKGTLTTVQRQRYRGLEVRNLVFVEDAVKVQHNNNGSLLPPTLNTDSMTTDLKLYKQMKEIRGRVKNLEIVMADVERIVAHEAYGMALMQYKFYQIGAKAGVPDAKAAVTQLEWRFKNHTDQVKKKGGPKER